MTLIGLVIRLAPYAVFCFMFNLAVLFGWDLLLRLGLYVLVVAGALALHMLLVYSLALRAVGGWSPLAFSRGVQEAMLMAFSTASSNATLPTALRVAENELKLPRRISRFVLTIGATANQNGPAMFEGVTVLFLAQFFGVELTLMDQAFVMLICILAGIGTAGAWLGTCGVDIIERTMGRVTGNSVSEVRRRGTAASTMGIWLLSSGSVAAKPRSAPWRGETGWCATALTRALAGGADVTALGATPTSVSSAASTETSLTGLRCSGQPVPPSLLPTSSTLPASSAYCTRCKACMLSVLTSRICASITSSCT